MCFRSPTLPSHLISFHFRILVYFCRGSQNANHFITCCLSLFAPYITLHGLLVCFIVRQGSWCDDKSTHKRNLYVEERKKSESWMGEFVSTRREHSAFVLRTHTHTHTYSHIPKANETNKKWALTFRRSARRNAWNALNGEINPTE